MNIILNHVSAGYENNHQVLKNLSFAIEEGQSVSVIGPNGSGKTTLLKVLAGILPYDGSISIEHNGVTRELRQFKRKALSSLIALMPQFSTVYFPYTVEETILLGRYVHTKSKFKAASPEDKLIVQQIMEQTRLTELAHRQVNELSGGQQQRVFLARTFAQQTPCILLDEPTSHLDLTSSRHLLHDLEEWEKRSTETIRHAALCVYHDLNLALSSSEYLLFLKDGEVISFGKKENILTSALLEKVFDMNVAEEMRKESRFWSEIK